MLIVAVDGRLRGHDGTSMFTQPVRQFFIPAGLELSQSSTSRVASLA
jgi:hypothetical protein